MYCKECGTENPNVAKFCIACGTALAPSEEPVEASTIPTATPVTDGATAPKSSARGKSKTSRGSATPTATPTATPAAEAPVTVPVQAAPTAAAPVQTQPTQNPYNAATSTPAQPQPAQPQPVQTQPYAAAPVYAAPTTPAVPVNGAFLSPGNSISDKPLGRVAGIFLLVAAVCSFVIVSLVAPNAIPAVLNAFGSGMAAPFSLIFGLLGALGPAMVVVAGFVLLSQSGKRKRAGMPNTWLKFGGIALLAAGAGLLATAFLGSLVNVIYQLQVANLPTGSSARNAALTAANGTRGILMMIVNVVALILLVGACILEFIAFVKAGKEHASLSKFLLLGGIGLVVVVLRCVYTTFLSAPILDALVKGGAKIADVSFLSTVIMAIWGVLVLGFYVATALLLMAKPKKG